MKILAVGDIHAQWSYLNNLINKRHPDIILQCGDFGWWPKFHNTFTIEVEAYPKEKFNLYGIKNEDCKIYWCDGNHEDHWDLRKYNKVSELMPNVYYMPKGSILKLPDGRKVLFIGGADSIDKKYRQIGVDWFPEEIITQQQIYNLPDEKIDIVISHTCPKTFMDRDSSFYEFKLYDPCNEALDCVLEKYKPDYWYFGHFHCFASGKVRNTNWFCLNILGFTNGWMEIG